MTITKHFDTRNNKSISLQFNHTTIEELKLIRHHFDKCRTVRQIEMNIDKYYNGELFSTETGDALHGSLICTHNAFAVRYTADNADAHALLGLYTDAYDIESLLSKGVQTSIGAFGKEIEKSQNLLNFIVPFRSKEIDCNVIEFKIDQDAYTFSTLLADKLCDLKSSNTYRIPLPNYTVIDNPLEQHIAHLVINMNGLSIDLRGSMSNSPIKLFACTDIFVNTMD